MKRDEPDLSSLAFASVQVGRYLEGLPGSSDPRPINAASSGSPDEAYECARGLAH
jgi:hypothetical protein